MKKMLALLVALCMVLSLCPALAEETQELKDARSYINLMYKNKPASTPKDYEVIGSVPGDSEVFTVEWTTDSDTIAVVREESGLVKIDVDENNPKEVSYKLTATILDAAGNSVQISFDRLVPAAINLDLMTEEEIVNLAYTLEDGDKLPAMTALTGKIVAIPSPYSEEYKNITVNIQVGDLADKPIQCYRLTGDIAAFLEEDMEIAVAGIIKNYKGTIEFDKDCVIIPTMYAQSARVALFAHGTLEDGAAMSRPSTMKGLVVAIPSAYSEEYKNITVNIAVPGLEDYFVQCYRLSGEGAETLKEGDVITVSGTIKNYKGTIEFDKGCTLDHIMTDDELIAVAFGDAEDLDGLGALLGGLLGGEGESGEGLEALLGGLLGGSDSGEEQSAESAVMGLLNQLGVDTTGMEEEITSAVGEVKSKLSDLGSSAKGLFGSVKESLGSGLNKLGDSLGAFLDDINGSVEQVKDSAGSELQEMRAKLEEEYNKAVEADPESQDAKILGELLEASKSIVEDDQESVKAFFGKVIEILFTEFK